MNVAGWLRDRIGWTAVTEGMSARTIAGNNPALYIGGVALMLLGLDVSSGILLLVQYQPSAEHAFESVARISGEYPYGDLVRGVHYWSSELLIGTLVLQVLSVALRGAFAPPRELVWLGGLALLVVTLCLAFTGAILPWTQEAYLQARVGSQLVGYVPFLGGALLNLLRGGEEVTSRTLQQVYGLHVAILPAALTAALALHLYVVLVAERRPQAQRSTGSGIPIYPEFVVRMAAVWVGVFLVVATLATFLPVPLGSQADPSVPVAVARPAWYLLFVHAVLKDSPPQLLGVDGPRFIGGALTAVFLLVAAVPFLDRRGSRITAALACVGLTLATLLSFHALY